MPKPDLDAELRRVIATASGRDAATLDPDADLVEALGLDSLAGLRVLAAVETRFKVRFPDDRLGEFRTLASLRAYINAFSP